jgi:hypothetical protein
MPLYRSFRGQRYRARVAPDAAFFGFYDPQGRIASVAISPNTGGGFAENQVSLIDQPHGTPEQANCPGQSIATLAGLYGGLDGAAVALGFSSVSGPSGTIAEVSKAHLCYMPPRSDGLHMRRQATLSGAGSR